MPAVVRFKIRGGGPVVAGNGSATAIWGDFIEDHHSHDPAHHRRQLDNFGALHCADANQHEMHSRSDLLREFCDLNRDREEHNKDLSFLFSVRHYMIEHLEHVSLELVSDGRSELIRSQRVTFEEILTEPTG